MKLLHLTFSFLCTLALAHPTRAADVATTFQSRVLPVLEAHCTKCHGAEKQKAKLNFAGPRDLARLTADRELWFRALDQIEAGEMPPKDEKQLSLADRKTILDWVRTDFAALQAAQQRREGRATLRRLTRTEYSNTIEDLFGVRPTIRLNLPGDGLVDGYDKVSGALPLSASSMAGYFRMADDILARLLKPTPRAKPAPKPKPTTDPIDDLLGAKTNAAPAAPAAPATTVAASKPSSRPFDPDRTFRAVARESEQSKGHILELKDGTMVSFNTDTTSGPLRGWQTPVPGWYRLRLSVYAYQTDKPLPFGIWAGHTGAYPQSIELIDVLEAPPGKPTIIETEVYLRTYDLNELAPVNDGIRLIPFGLGVQVPKNFQASNCKGPGLAVQWIEAERPETPLPGDRWLKADLQAATQTGSLSRETLLKAVEATFKRVGARLYRRDLTDPELKQLVAQVDAHLDERLPVETALRDRITEMMTTPDFLCLIEEPGELPPFALASRLAYFLWNSTPDETLLDLARSGRLRDAAVLREQTDRLLKDPKAARFVKDFTDQWLGLRAIDDTSPDSKLYPEYARNELLKHSSVRETRAFFRRLLDENLSVRNFVAAPWTLANASLARHYGLPALTGLELQKVSLPPDSPYGGLWTQPAILKVTANGTYTSPVKRGVWVAERLLGIPIPPPPPDIPAVDPDTRGAKTLREQLDLHRSLGACAGCHAKFDPYGFALESFDVTGTYRKNYRILNPTPAKGSPAWTAGLPVDATGKTPDGQPFTGIADLRQLLAKKPEQLARGVTRHLVTYATGAPATRLDQPAIDTIVAAAAREDYGLRSLVHALVQSELFRWK